MKCVRRVQGGEALLCSGHVCHRTPTPHTTIKWGLSPQTSVPPSPPPAGRNSLRTLAGRTRAVNLPPWVLRALPSPPFSVGGQSPMHGAPSWAMWTAAGTGTHLVGGIVPLRGGADDDLLSHLQVHDLAAAFTAAGAIGTARGLNNMACWAAPNPHPPPPKHIPLPPPGAAATHKDLCCTPCMILRSTSYWLPSSGPLPRTRFTAVTPACANGMAASAHAQPTGDSGGRQSCGQAARGKAAPGYHWGRCWTSDTYLNTRCTPPLTLGGV